MARFKQAVDRKQPWLNTLEEAYHYASPRRNDFFNKTKGSKKNEDVYDSTAVIGLKRFATRLQTTLVPSWRRWATMIPGEVIPENEREEVAEALQGITETFFMHLNFSNFSVRGHESFQDLGIST